VDGSGWTRFLGPLSAGRDWADKLTELGEPVPKPSGVGLRCRVLTWLAKRFSVDVVLPLVERAERADAGLYDNDPDATPDMAIGERSHWC